VSDHITEEEQIEAIKRWWKENGRSIVIGVVLAVAGYFAWQGWQTQQQQAREASSVLYSDLMDTANVEPGQQITEDQVLKVKAFASTLKETYGDTLYAAEAALVLAKVAVEQNDFSLAESELTWVIDTEVNLPLALLARQRLAQVFYGQGKYAEALSILDEAEAGSFTAIYSELRGDVFVAQEKTPEAVTAYEQAIEALLEPQQNRSGIIQMKLDDIQVASAENVATARVEQAPIEADSEAEGTAEPTTEPDSEASTTSNSETEAAS